MKNVGCLFKNKKTVSEELTVLNTRYFFEAYVKETLLNPTTVASPLLAT